jgi:hypothetical protein
MFSVPFIPQNQSGKLGRMIKHIQHRSAANSTRDLRVAVYVERGGPPESVAGELFEYGCKSGPHFITHARPACPMKVTCILVTRLQEVCFPTIVNHRGRTERPIVSGVWIDRMCSKGQNPQKHPKRGGKAAQSSKQTLLQHVQYTGCPPESILGQ